MIINLNLASMRNLHYIVTPFYICVLTIIVCGIIGICDRENFLPAMEELQQGGMALFWILVIVVNGSCNVFAFLFKHFAYKHDRV